MAAKVYSRPSIEAVSADDRKRVKKVVLAIIYGMGVVKVMEDLQITLKEANQLVGQFHAQYPNIRRFMSNVKSAAKRDGYVQTISGVRRYLPAITSSNTGVRAAAERAAINSVVQGSAADILKQAMCELDTEIAVWARRMGDRQVRMPRLIMSIHDEVIYEVHNSHIDHFVGMLKRVMEHDIPRHFNFPIPLVINVESGVDWGSAQPYVSPSTPKVRGAD
jgi:DNA polymerase I